MPAGQYASETDIRDLFGSDNVTRWSQLDNTVATPDEDRIQRALDHADAEINGFFLGGPYALPLAGPSDGATTTRWAATIAGVWLYAARGQQDGNASRYDQMLADVYTDMAKYKSGVKRLTAANSRFPMPTGPEAI